MSVAQRAAALERANEVRLPRAALRRDLKARRVLAADVVLAVPACAETWAIGKLLGAQPRWGPSRVQLFLALSGISEGHPAGLLTDRQRRVLSEALR